jgi:small-conductance mechanosensitive channel
LSSLLLVSNFVIPQEAPAESGITFQEFLDKRDKITGNFTDYNPSDIIEVEDVIEEIHFRGDEKFDTELWLRSTGTSLNSPSLIFISDLESDFKKGEKVRITFTIISNETGIGEDYVYNKGDIEHITFIREDEKEEEGIEFFGYTFSLPEQLDNNFGRFIIYFIIWLVIALIVYVISDQIIKWIITRTKFDVSILKIIRKPVFVLILLYGLIISLSALKISEEVIFWLQQVYNIGLFITIIWLVYKILNVALLQLGRSLAKGKKNKVENVLIPILQKLIGVFIFVFAIFTLLGFIGVDLTVLAVGGVLISMVIAFAAQDTLSNFFAGMFLAAEPDFKEGDLILFDDNAYEVKHVGMRNSKLYDTKEHMLVITPNNLLANNKIINLSEPDMKLKLFINIGVAYGTDPNKVKKILLDIANNHPHVLKEPEEFKPVVRFWEFADSSLNFKLIVWLDNTNERFAVRNDINFEIDKKFKEEKVEIPFPQRVVHMRNS